jgi:hypothetical protein
MPQTSSPQLNALKCILFVALIRRARARAKRRRAMHPSSRLYTLPLTGNAWVASLISGAHARFLAQARMPRSVYQCRCRHLQERRLLRATRCLNVETKVMLFLKLVGHGCSVRNLAERFQVSVHTVTKTIKDVLGAIIAIAGDYIKMPTGNEDISLKILDNSKYYPFFKNCIGAADGTHITVTVPAREHHRLRNRKGGLSQNVLAITDVEGRFIYVLAGWEGQANDMAVLNDALTRRGLVIPKGKFLLVDGGYANRVGHIAPFRGVRYHLKEFARGDRGPLNAKELFNLRHSSLRTVVERVFGIMKKRFAILRHGCQYDLGTQVKMVQALCVLHNFIFQHKEGNEPDFVVAEPM